MNYFNMSSLSHILFFVLKIKHVFLPISYNILGKIIEFRKLFLIKKIGLVFKTNSNNRWENKICKDKKSLWVNKKKRSKFTEAVGFVWVGRGAGVILFSKERSIHRWARGSDSCSEMDLSTLEHVSSNFLLLCSKNWKQACDVVFRVSV